MNLERLLQLQADFDGLSSTANQNADTPSSSTLLAILENKEKTINSLESRVDVLQVRWRDRQTDGHRQTHKDRHNEEGIRRAEALTE